MAVLMVYTQVYKCNIKRRCKHHTVTFRNV